MKNQEIASIFSEIADLMEIIGEDRFRINSYRKAARAVSELSEPIEEIAAAGGLEKIPGIGKSTAAKIYQYVDTGKIETHQELLSKIPPKLPGLLTIGGLGPKTVAKLWKQAEITSVDDLKKALKGDPKCLTRIEGLGPTKIRQLWESLLFLESVGGRIRLGEANILAAELVDQISTFDGVERIEPAGSLRRGQETIGDIDILCEAKKTQAAKIIEKFTQLEDVQRVLAKGTTKGSVVLKSSVQADLRVVEAKSFGSALAYFTGSKAHNVRLREIAIKKGLKLNEYGLFKGSKQIAGADEQGVYKALGLPWMVPELREDRGEIEAASEGKLPRLISLKDIHADLHMHTDASDGLNTIAEMVAACRAKGYTCMAICDHSKSQIQANGLDEKRLAQHVKAIRKEASKFKDISILTGIEVDIFKDGSLDFASDVLEQLDFVTASPHSALSMGRDEATKRLIKAIEHPHVNCIGHPSGRLINARPGMELDIDSIAAAAAANDVALEINAHYMRLDLRDVHVRAAISAGAKIMINTDAHSIEDLELMSYGVMTAKRGWASCKDVINTWSVDKIKKWLAKS